MEWIIEEGYRVYPNGEVYNKRGHRMTPVDNGTGYYQFLFSHKGKQVHVLAHRIVAYVFLGPCPEGYEVDHIDRNRANNSASNLQYLTHIENVRRRKFEKHYTKRLG